jgi:hypothetical protein
VEDIQTRDVPGAHIRRQARHRDVVRFLRDAHLPNVQRGIVIEYVNTAEVRDGREPLGGARYLHRAAEDMPDLWGLRQTMGRLAGAFVHPRLK